MWMLFYFSRCFYELSDDTLSLTITLASVTPYFSLIRNHLMSGGIIVCLTVASSCFDVFAVAVDRVILFVVWPQWIPSQRILKTDLVLGLVLFLC